MSLILQISGLDRLENGEAARLVLNRHGAVIGRSAHADWCLPDSKNYISSQHCEVTYAGGAYLLTDRSTNGTFVNHGATRLDGSHTLANGDVITVGQYEIVARLEGEAGQAASSTTSSPASGQQGQWGGWDSHVPATPVGVEPSSWDRPAPQAAISGQGPLSQSWTPPRAETPPPAAPVASAWNQPAEPVTPASAWSSEPAAHTAPSAVDVWGQLAQTNDVDWDRGGFGAPAPVVPASLTGAPKSQSAEASLGIATDAWRESLETPEVIPGPSPFSAPQASPSPAPSFAQPAPQPTAPPSPAPVASTPAGMAPSGAEWSAFLIGAGIEPSDVKSSPVEAMSAAGVLLRRLVAGMVVMMEARMRAKAQLGAQGTGLELEGNNPLKFARTPERAIAQLLNPQERGFMPATRAIEDSFQDLQAHQMATLAAMQGALAATLARFSPSSIRDRAETKGLMAKILPGAKAAALWQAYEREFEGVAKGSDEAFMDIFAKEFRQAYDQASIEMKTKRR